MTSSLVLYDTITEQIRDYPRRDDEPVDGLDPRFLVLQVVRDPAPVYDPSVEFLIQTRTADLQALEWRWGWEIRPLPPPLPNWLGFYQGLPGTGAYAAMMAEPATADQARALALFLATLRDAVSGRADVAQIRSALGLLLAQISLSPADVEELHTLMAACHVDGLLLIEVPEVAE